MSRNSHFLLLATVILAAINLRPALTSVAPLMERIVEDLALDRATAGLVTTIPVLLMGLLAPVASRLAARFGQERVISAALGLIAGSLLLRILAVHGFGWLVLSAFGVGAGIALAGPLMSSFIKHHFPPSQMGFAIATYSVFTTLGAALGVALALPVTQWSDGHWPWSLAFWATPALLALPVWILMFPGPQSTYSGGRRRVGLPLRSRRAWLLTLFFAAQSGIFYGLATWLVARYEQAQFSATQASGYGTLFMAMGIGGAFLLPLLAARLRDRRLLLMGVTGGTCTFLLLIAWVPTLLPWLFSSLLGVAVSGTFALALALPMLETDTPAAAANLTSMMLSFGYLIASFLPSLLGVIRDVSGDYSLAFTALAGLAFIMVIISALLPAPHRLE